MDTFKRALLEEDPREVEVVTSIRELVVAIPQLTLGAAEDPRNQGERAFEPEPPYPVTL